MHYCSIKLNNGKIGLIIGVSRPGVFGNYFFQIGSKHISKMGVVDIDSTSEIVCGEKIS